MGSMTPTVATALGVAVGGAYFMFEEMHQPPDSNCSYLSPITTDILAFMGAGLLIWRGHQTKDPLIAAIGGAVLGIHTGQAVHFKVPKLLG